MLDKIKDLVKKYAGNSIEQNPAIPNERNEEAVEETSNSIFDTLKNAVSGAGLKDLMGMFSNGRAEQSSPVVRDAMTNATQNLQNKYGIGEQEAAGIAGSVVPNVMNELAQKTADPADKNFNVQDIFNNLSGGKTSGTDMSSMLSKFKAGMDKDGDGDVDFNDLKSLISGGAGGVMDKVKGMFK